jgi:hypothetical protein
MSAERRLRERATAEHENKLARRRSRASHSKHLDARGSASSRTIKGPGARN